MEIGDKVRITQPGKDHHKVGKIVKSPGFSQKCDSPNPGHLKMWEVEIEGEGKVELFLEDDLELVS